MGGEGLILKGAVEMITYMIQCEGDLDKYPPIHCNSLKSALKIIEEYLPQPDPEDDRILVWEILESGHKKVVWHCSGWHWPFDYEGLEQGCLIGHNESYYYERLQDCEEE